MRKFGIAAALSASALVAVAVLLVGGAPRFSGAADHLEAPLVQTDGRLDINDIYAYKNGSNTVLIMTVNPLAGVPGFSPTTFSPDAVYQFKIDNDDDLEADIAYRIEFSAEDSNGKQELTLSLVTGADAEDDTGTGVEIAKGKTARSNDSRRVNPITSGGGKLYAGLRDDPFFFDFLAFLDQVKGAGGGRLFCDADPAPDFFAGVNVSAIVLEVPSSDLTGATDVIKVWGTTNLAGNQFERMGIPVIATVLIPDGSEDDYNLTVPTDDVMDWSVDVEASLLALSGLDGTPYSTSQAAFVRSLLLPDVLTLDTTSAAGFVPGLNGRQLAEDVIDFELFVVTGGLGAGAVLDSDCVAANDVPFLGAFPYLADPH